MNLLEVCLFTMMAAIGLAECLAEWSPSRYVQVPDRFHYDAGALDWLARLLGQQTTASSPDEVAHYLEDIFDRIRNGQELPLPYEADKGGLKQELKCLVDVSKLTLSSCGHDEVDHFIVMVRHLFGGLDALQAGGGETSGPLLNYLRHFARAKFDACSQRYYEYHLESSAAFKGFGVSRDLDYLIGSQDDHVGEMTGEHLLELARLTDLAGGRFEARKMRRAQKWLTEKPAGLVWSSAKKLVEFLTKRCACFLATYRLPLNMVNIHRLLDPRALVPGRMLTLNEFARLCHQVSDPDTEREVRAHFKRQLAGKLTQVASKSLTFSGPKN